LVSACQKKKESVLIDKELRNKTKLAIQGDTAAFDDICAAKRREMYFTAFAMLGSKEEAEDVVQDTILSMFKSIGRLKNPNAINAWMHTILHDSCVNIIRKNDKRVPALPLGEEIIDTFAEKDTVGEPEKIFGDREIYEELYRGISTLPEKARESLVLYYFSDMKYREIAEITNTSIKTVSSNIVRAKKHLKFYMKEHCPEIASISSILLALNIDIAGSSIAAAGLGVKKTALTSKGIITAMSNSAVPLATGAAGVAVAVALTFAALATPNYEIALSGDCECGHINPQSIKLEGVRANDSFEQWELLAQDGNILYTGNLDSVTNYVSELENSHRNGHYVLRCIITNDRNGNRYSVTRDITIGDLLGDE
jgi:RNA polymerase sigma-70 factor (ECF subfamily)